VRKRSRERVKDKLTDKRRIIVGFEVTRAAFMKRNRKPACNTT
jgi:hypothetical protein